MPRGFESHPLRIERMFAGIIRWLGIDIARVGDGEVLEWLNRHAWRACVAFGDRGFESHPLRQSQG